MSCIYKKWERISYKGLFLKDLYFLLVNICSMFYDPWKVLWDVINLFYIPKNKSEKMTARLFHSTREMVRCLHIQIYRLFCWSARSSSGDFSSWLFPSFSVRQLTFTTWTLTYWDPMLFSSLKSGVKTWKTCLSWNYGNVVRLWVFFKFRSMITFRLVGKLENI